MWRENGISKDIGDLEGSPRKRLHKNCHLMLCLSGFSTDVLEAN